MKTVLFILNFAKGSLKTFACLVTFSMTLSLQHAHATPPFVRILPVIHTIAQDTGIESKVDYLEKIYFSGENKEGLNNLILRTIQGFDGKPATASVASQYSFLSGIKDRAQAAENSCDVAELLAAGIYNFDVNEAIKHNIPKPSAKVSGQLSSLISSSRNLGYNANSLAYNSYILSNGNVSGYNTLSKVGNTANTVSTVGNTVSQGKQTAEQLKGLGKSFGLIKDKPCKSVPAKEIQISEHVLPTTSVAAAAPTKFSGSTITIKNINYSQLSSISSAIEKISGVTSVNSDNYSNKTAVIMVSHNLKLKELIDNIMKTNGVVKFEVDDLKADSAILSMK